MSKQKIYTGYAIVTKDILDDKVYKSGHFGISLDGKDLETCKQYCRKDQIVVRTYQTVLSKGFSIRWVKKYPCFAKSYRYSSPRYIQLWHLIIEWETRHTNGYERQAVYKPEES